MNEQAEDVRPFVIDAETLETVVEFLGVVQGEVVEVILSKWGQRERVPTQYLTSDHDGALILGKGYRKVF